MFLLLILYSYTIVTCTLLYILLMGQTNFHKNGIVGKLHGCITSLPKRLLDVFVSGLCGRKGVNACKRMEKYLCFQRNPILQIVYLTLNAGNVFLYFMTLYHMIPNVLVPSYHKVLSVIIVLMSYSAYWKACFANPGVIDHNSEHAFAKSFKVDHVLYFEGRKCPTCGIVKPPRSKHCVVTNQCVARFDHFCGWLNNDVGELNYRWFHLFLITNFIACFYGVFLYCLCLYSVVVEENLMDAVFMTQSGEKIPATLRIVLQYMVGSYLLPIGQTFFLLAIGLMLFGFWAYHCYLTLVNTTTNETFKWDDIKKLHNIISSHRRSALKNNTDPDDLIPLYHKLYDNDKNDNNDDDDNDNNNNNEDTKKKDKTKKRNRKNDHNHHVEKEWRLKQLQAINENIKSGNTTFQNEYSKGFWYNIREVMFPRAAPLVSYKPKSKFT